MADEQAVRALYQGLIEAWNAASASAFADLFLEDGDAIGFDGTKHSGRERIAGELGAIFNDHATGRYVAKIRDVRGLADGAAMLHADVGMVPAGATDLKPELNARQVLVTERRDGKWFVVLFQTTPAALHGQPDEVQALTDELREEMRGAGGGSS
jgi:uncharacterized protein (TIGR02246 family)